MTSYNKSFGGFISSQKDDQSFPDKLAIVTQASTINTGVTLNYKRGVITTVSADTAAEDADVFTVTCSECVAGAVVLVSIQDYAGTYNSGGIPHVNVDNVVDGAFDIVITNACSDAALSGILKIAFQIVTFGAA